MKSLAPQLRLPQGCPSVFAVKRFFGSCIPEAYLDVVASVSPHGVGSKSAFSRSELKCGGWKSLVHLSANSPHLHMPNSRHEDL